jgi:hypothetical protein
MIKEEIWHTLNSSAAKLWRHSELVEIENERITNTSVRSTRRAQVLTVDFEWEGAWGQR